MTREEIKNRIEIIIQNSLNELEVESSKFDFKRKWYDLTELYQLNEFIRDTSAIVNTVGLDGFIVIGFDDKTKKFYDSKISDCGLKDLSDIQNLIIKKCSDVFEINCFDYEINSHLLSVIHIPPFKYKPVVIPSFIAKNKNGQKTEEHRIFVRKNSRTFYANKMDLEKMYYDRKNVELEYEYYIELLDYTVHNSPTPMGSKKQIHNNIRLNLTFENLGRRDVLIKSATIKIENENGPLILDLNNIWKDSKMIRLSGSTVFKVGKNQSEQIQFEFREFESGRKIMQESFKTIDMVVNLNNGKILSKNIEVHHTKLI